jgi:hypothetical protein
VIKIEIWRDIENYGGLYKVSNYGEIKSLKRGKEKILKPSISTSGYLQVVLCDNAKTKSYFVHKLVASAFIENKGNYKEINHKDENKLNNSVDNLEWCNREYNMAYGSARLRQGISRGNPVKQLAMDNIVIARYSSANIASILTNIDPSSIIKCCQGKRKYAGGYAWQYDEKSMW